MQSIKRTSQALTYCAGKGIRSFLREKPIKYQDKNLVISYSTSWKKIMPFSEGLGRI